MADSGEPPPSPVKGIVIITLPPPDSPTQTKTITAFSVPLQLPSNRTPTPPPLPLSPPTPTPRSLSLTLRKPLIALLSAAIVVFLLRSWASYRGGFEFLGVETGEDGEERREVRSMLFPLYQKRIAAAELRLGKAHIGLASAMRRRRKVVDSFGKRNESVVFAVNGNVFPTGMYYTIIHVGNPPRDYYLDIDTGSDLTWIQCDAPCASCAKGPNPLYKPSKSKIVPSRDSLCIEVQSNQNSKLCDTCTQCDYEIEYADHSSSMGVLVKDDLSLDMVNNDIANPTFVFGCAYDQQGQLLASPAQTDGILGLSGAKVGLPSQLASQGIITNVAGHCIAKNQGNSGYIFLGDEFVPHWGMTWIPMVRSSLNFYVAEMRKLKYGAEQLSLTGKGSNRGLIVFDTGSSYSYFTNAAYADLITSLKAVNGLAQDISDQTLPICWRATTPIRSIEDVRRFFKPLTIHFRSAWLFISKVMVIQPEGYLIISNKGNVCLGILNGTDVHDGSFNILGDISLQGQLVVYDNVEERIGWMHSHCSKPHKMDLDFAF